MAQKMYVDVNEIMKDWGCSRAKGYQIIAELNAQLLKMNPHFIIVVDLLNCHHTDQLSCPKTAHFGVSCVA